MKHQECQYENTIIKVPVRHINGEPYLFLKDVHDCFPNIRYFTYKKKQIPFEHDEKHNRLQPERIHVRDFLGKTIECHSEMNQPKLADSNDVDVKQELMNVRADLKKILDNTEILKKQADRILRQIFELSEFTVPRLFIMLPDDTHRYNPTHWFHLNFRLHFLCEGGADKQPHFALHEGYEIKQPREFLRKYGPHLCKMLTVVKFSLTAGSLVVPQLQTFALGSVSSTAPLQRIPWDHLNTRIERLEAVLKESGDSTRMSSNNNFEQLEGVELREIQSFLKKSDTHRTFGNLYRSVTNDGHVRWVCIHHYQENYQEKRLKDLEKNFQRLGGEINGDTAIIPSKTSSKLPEIFELFQKGLQIFSIVLKDHQLKENLFDNLINLISNQSFIHKLELENITLPFFAHRIKKRRILAGLEMMIQNNHHLAVQYTFKRSLNRFTSKLFADILRDEPRIMFRVRSNEKSPSIELDGTKLTGFSLSIGFSEVDQTYQNALRNIFTELPNIIKVHFNSNVKFDKIWPIIGHFFDQNETLQYLAIDCFLTLEQTRELFSKLKDIKTLKTLSICNIWDSNDELIACEDVLDMLTVNKNLREFSLVCNVSHFEFSCTINNDENGKSLENAQDTRCNICQTIDTEVVQCFLRKLSIQSVCLEMIGIDNEEYLKRLANTIDENEAIETLELKSAQCYAVFHRQEPMDKSENNSACASPILPTKKPRKTKMQIFSGLSRIFREKRACSAYEDTNPLPNIQMPENNKKAVSIESFYKLCDYPPLYKPIREITKQFDLVDLQVAVKPDVEMRDISASLIANLTVNRLLITNRKLTEDDVQDFVQAFGKNSAVTHLSLNEVDIPLDSFRLIFTVLQTDQQLKKLHIRKCVSHRDHFSFIEEIQKLEIYNPHLQVIYESE